MMGLTTTVKGSGHWTSGEVYVHGTVTFDNLYVTGGETLDLSSYILSTDSPTVLLNGDDGYVARHDRGTAAAGTVLLYYDIASSTNAASAQVAVNTDVSAVICPFVAIGQTP